MTSPNPKGRACKTPEELTSELFKMIYAAKSPHVHFTFDADKIEGMFRQAMQQARREGMREAANLDLLEFVNESTRRKEAQADLEAAGRVGVPMACAAVELYRSAIKVRAAERLGMLTELGGDDD